jgi:hypothetical protein
MNVKILPRFRRLKTGIKIAHQGNSLSVQTDETFSARQRGISLIIFLFPLYAKAPKKTQ